jgi:SagB-type dehydrogenase family enzyme
MALPREILDHVDRVIEYHQTGKYADGSYVRPPETAKPPPPRNYDHLPKIALPTTLLDVPVTTLSLLYDGIESVPPSLQHPPQNLKTLASWLYMAGGLRTSGGKTVRSYPSDHDAYPSEIYVAAFALSDLDPGFYHFSPREFALRKLREGAATLAMLKRGRPDLAMLKTLPAALLVSTLFSRATAHFQRRGYRSALLDAGHLTQNLITAATGLGIQTLVRLRLTEANTRELIGLPFEAEFADAESVQTMVVWADTAEKPRVEDAPAAPLEIIPRPPPPKDIQSFGSVLAVHEDCVATGMAIREVRPPLTELSILAREFPVQPFEDLGPPSGGQNLWQTLNAYNVSPDFQRGFISRDALWQMNRVAFRGGSYFPLFPDGQHMALIRPFWCVRAVNGVLTDEWNVMAAGDFSEQVAHLALDNGVFANAAAVCVLMTNISRLLTMAGPDLYRLALLEAGIAAQRIYLAAAAQGVGFQMSSGFYDEAARSFFGVEKTGWEPLYMLAVGQPAPVKQAPRQIPAALRITRASDFYKWE